MSKSFIRKLDARCKLYWLLIYTLVTIISWQLRGTAVCFAVAVLMVILSGYTFADIYRSGSLLLIAELVASVIYMIAVGPLTGVSLLMKLVSVTAACIVFSRTTSDAEIPDMLTMGLGVKPSTARVLTGMIIYLPMMGREHRRTDAVLVSRGIGMGKFRDRLWRRLITIPPRVKTAYRRVRGIMTSMTLRCYEQSSGRIRVSPLRYRRVDAVAFLLLVLYVVVCVAVMVI